MTETTPPYDALAVGARVREFGHTRLGMRLGMVRKQDADLVLVLWDDGPESGWYHKDNLEVIDAPPARAPERELCPGVVQREGVCGGRPCIAGTAVSTQGVYSNWHEGAVAPELIPNCYVTPITTEQVKIAIAFEAGIRHERERREARKERRRARRWEAGKAAAEGVYLDAIGYPDANTREEKGIGH